MADPLDYRTRLPPKSSPSRGTLARAAMVAAVATCVAESAAFGLMFLVGRPAWLVLGCAILIFPAWFLTVVFGVVALVDRDGPRALAGAALAIAAAGACMLALVPLVR
jgi:hypothetical protein